MRTNTRQPMNKLILGGAQLGLNYGIHNILGKPSAEKAKQLINRALSLGISYIDTARVYGNSETVIGNSLSTENNLNLKIITKLDLPEYRDSLPSKADIITEVNNQIQHSRDSLKNDVLHSVLMHRVCNLTAYNGEAWNRLVELKKEGFIKHLGVSVQTVDELKISLQDPKIEYIQMPFNILDKRWQDSINCIKKTKNERNLKIHVRSVFLQGLLLSSNPTHWKRANTPNSEAVRNWLISTVKRFKRKSIADLCLAYVRSLDWIDAIVIGMESNEQLEANIALFSTPVFSSDEIFNIESNRPILTESTLNPGKWVTE